MKDPDEPAATASALTREVGRSYDAIAERWQAAGFPRENGIAQHERAVAFTTSRDHALDVGCGCSGRIFELLQRHGFAVEGIDVSARMVELARRQHPEIPIHHADICQWPLPRRYDFISAWDSIWHVPLAAQEAVLAKLLGNLTPCGVCIFTTGGVDQPSEKRDAAMGPPMYHSALGIGRTLEVVAAAGAVCRHLEYDQHPEPHVYLIVQKQV